LLARFPALAVNDARVFELLKRYPAAAILLARFLCGLRSATAAMMGATDIRAAKFCALNALGAGAWAGIVAGAGYAFGAVAPDVGTDLQRLEAILLAGLVLGGGLYCVRRRRRLR
jgi:membrane protein DedA with SNARE-associated domain